MVKISGSAFRHAFARIRSPTTSEFDFMSLAPVVENQKLFVEWKSIDTQAPGGTEKAKFLHDQLLVNGRVIKSFVEENVKNGRFKVKSELSRFEPNRYDFQIFDRENYFVSAMANVAFAGKQDLHSGELHIEGLRVDDRFRYMGFGSILYREIEKWARANGYHLLSVEPRKDDYGLNDTPFWKKMGFDFNQQLGNFMYKEL